MVRSISWERQVVGRICMVRSRIGRQVRGDDSRERTMRDNLGTVINDIGWWRESMIAVCTDDREWWEI